MEKISLSGYPDDIGFLHGKLWSSHIHWYIGLYMPIILSNPGEEAKVLGAEQSFKDLINEFITNDCMEIEPIALWVEV